MNEIKPIETRYKGYRFRSRLEARWAVYFSALGLKWEYEVEGFDLGNGVLYLPDFWLPQVEMWAEVKPAAFDADELQKAALLCWKSGKKVLLLDGHPAERTFGYLVCIEANTWGEVGIEIGVDVGEGEELIQKWDCVVSMHHNYPVDERRFYSNTGGVSIHDFDPRGPFEDVRYGVMAARAARFEHGEQW